MPYPFYFFVLVTCCPFFFTCTAYFVVATPRYYIGDRGWSLSYLGPVPSYKYYYWRVGSCSRLAQLKGFDHFVLRQDDKSAHCYSSHAIPANVYKIKSTTARPDRSNREYNFPYFIKGKSELLWYLQFLTHKMTYSGISFILSGILSVFPFSLGNIFCTFGLNCPVDFRDIEISAG